MRKRNHAVTIRMNDAEYGLLQKKVAESGQTQQAVLIAAIQETKLVPAEGIEELKIMNRHLAELVRQIRGMATNLNQLAHQANVAGRIPELHELEQMHMEMKNQRKESEGLWQSIRQSISQQRPTGQ